MYFANKVDEVSEEWFFAEVFANHLEDPSSHNDRVVDSIKSDSLYAVPAGPAITGDARILNIVRHVEMGLELERVASGCAMISGGKSRGRWERRDRPMQRTSQARLPGSIPTL